MKTEIANKDNLNKAYSILQEQRELSDKIEALTTFIAELKDRKDVPTVYLAEYLKGYSHQGGLGFVPLDLTKEEVYLFAVRLRDRLQNKLDAIKLPEITFFDE